MSEPSESRHVFLSYCREDAHVMRQLRDSLIAAGLIVWTDESLEPGTPSWKASIEHAIERAGALVVILSPNAKSSQWVEREMDYAGNQGVRIFPILVRGDERSAIPLELVNVQWVDLRPGQDFGAGVGRLIGALFGHLRPDATLPSPVQHPSSPPAPTPSFTPTTKTPFFRRWWRLGAMCLVFVGVVLASNWLGYIFAALVLAGIAFEHMSRQRWLRAGLFILSAITWLIAAASHGLTEPVYWSTLISLFVCVGWAFIDAALDVGV